MNFQSSATPYGSVAPLFNKYWEKISLNFFINDIIYASPGYELVLKRIGLRHRVARLYSYCTYRIVQDLFEFPRWVPCTRKEIAEW